MTKFLTRLFAIILSLGIAKQARVLLYCAVGERSTLAVEIAKELGLENVAHIPGGFKAWQKAGGAVEPVA